MESLGSAEIHHVHKTRNRTTNNKRKVSVLNKDHVQRLRDATEEQLDKTWRAAGKNGLNQRKLLPVKRYNTDS